MSNDNIPLKDLGDDAGPATLMAVQITLGMFPGCEFDRAQFLNQHPDLKILHGWSIEEARALISAVRVCEVTRKEFRRGIKWCVGSGVVCRIPGCKVYGDRLVLTAPREADDETVAILRKSIFENITLGRKITAEANNWLATHAIARNS